MTKALTKGDWLIQRAHRIIAKTCREVHGGPKWDGPCNAHKIAASLIAIGDWSGAWARYKKSQRRDDGGGG